MTNEILTQLPTWTRAEWSEDRRELLNRDAGPLWSGPSEPPAIGAVVPIMGSAGYTLTVTGYQVDGCWLMLWGTRNDGMTGNLAGAEISKRAAA